MNFVNLNYFGKTATSLCGCCCFYCLISRAILHGGGDEAADAVAVTKSISGPDEAASY
jgi:hypothetical protein